VWISPERDCHGDRREQGCRHLQRQGERKACKSSRRLLERVVRFEM
jgi:hypothetical protein